VSIDKRKMMLKLDPFLINPSMLKGSSLYRCLLTAKLPVSRYLKAILASSIKL